MQKELFQDTAEKVKHDQEIPLKDLEEIIPYPEARNLALKGPPDVVLSECACRHARASPCQPNQVHMFISQPLPEAAHCVSSSWATYPYPDEAINGAPYLTIFSMLPQQHLQQLEMASEWIGAQHRSSLHFPTGPEG